MLTWTQNGHAHEAEQDGVRLYVTRISGGYCALAYRNRQAYHIHSGGRAETTATWPTIEEAFATCETLLEFVKGDAK